MASRTITVEILGDASSLQRAFGQAGREAQTFGGRMSGLGKTAAIAAGGAGIAGLTFAVKTGISEFAQHAKVAAQTAAVLKSTGGAAKVTSKQVSDLANSILKYSGIDDEAIQSGENMLLTFTNIRNEAGKGNDVFTQATKVMADLSVATGRDMRSSAVLLGKALNDPVRGMTQLRRVGVQFTQAQQDQIKAMVAAGDIMGAQAIIIGELNKKYEGSAEAAGKTLPGQLKILREEFNNLAGQGIAIALQKIQELKPAFDTFIGVIQSLMPILKPFATFIFDIFVTPMKVLTDLIRGDWTAAWDDFKKPVMDAISVITGLLSGIGELIGGYFQDALNAVTGKLSDAYNAAHDFGARLLTGMKDGVVGFAEWVVDVATAGVKAVTDKVTAAYNAAKDFGAKILTGMKDGILGFVNWIISLVTGGVKAITDKLTAAYNAAKDFGGKILQGMKDGIVGFATWIGGRISDGIQAVTGAAERAYSAAKRFAGRILDGIVDGLKDLGSKLLDLIVAPINRIIDGINAIKIPGISFHVNTHIPGVGTVGFSTPEIDPFPGDIPHLAMGGIVTGPTLAMLGEGGRPEAVVPLGRGVGGPVVNVTVNGPLMGTTLPEVANTIYRELVRRSGRDSSLGLT